MEPFTIEVWSDIACPWCYVGKRRLEAALARFPHADAVDVVWRAFELDPAAPRKSDSIASYAERLARKYRVPTSQAEAMIDRMVEVGKGDGISFRFDRVQPTNTFDAHRVIHLGREGGKQDQIKERLLRAYMTEGEALGEPEVLQRLGVEAGLDAQQLRSVLANGTYAEQVRADETRARELGIQGVPFFVLEGRYAVSGAQPADLLLRALQQAWGERAKSEPLAEPLAEGAVCGPEGCA